MKISLLLEEIEIENWLKLKSNRFKFQLMVSKPFARLK
jgi:hypothetical protein